MAKPKKEVAIRIIAGFMEVWCDNPSEAKREIEQIEGVSKILAHEDKVQLVIFADPRYDIQEIAQEIKELLTAKVPDIFKESNND